jgi:copper chaperone CopZ
MKDIELKLKGMHCKSCVMLVNEALIDIKGVKSANAELEKSNVKISFDDNLVKEKQLIDAIEKEGYKVNK